MARQRQPLVGWMRSAVLATVVLAAGLASPFAVQRAEARQPAVREAAAPVQVASVEGITEYELSNGLRVLLFPDQTKPMTTVNVTYFVGSRHESYGETGMAHLLEHLLFKGTPTHPNIPQELTERGARPNGTTWFDRTNYFETFPATDENLRWAIGLEADRMVNSFVRKEDLDSEMTVVRNEFEAGENSPGNVLRQRTMGVAYEWHNYGKSTIGARADIENVPIERLQAFYRRHYQPDNALVVVAGKFDEAMALDLIQETFGAIPRPERTADNMVYPTYTLEPAQDGERQVTVRRAGDVQLLTAAYHVPPGSHDDYAAVAVLAHALGNTPSGRLHRSLVETGKASAASAGGYQLREPGMLFLNATVRRDDSLDEVSDIVLRTVDEAITGPFTDEEIDRARTAMLRSWDMSYNVPERIAIQLSEWAAMGDWRLLFLHRDRVREITPEDVQRVAAVYLKPANRTLGMFIPTDAPDRVSIPAAPDLVALLSDYTGDEAVAAGEAFDPSPANIESRTTRTTLPGGLGLALVPKQTRGATVYLTITLRHGSEATLMNRGEAPGLAGGMLMRGTERRSRQEITDELNRLKAQGGVTGGTTSANVNVETTRDNLPAVLRLVGEILREPAFDAAEFDQLKRQMLASLEAQLSEPGPRAFNAFQRHVNPRPQGHPLYTSTPEERIEAINAATLEDVRRFYADFYGASRGEMAVVGDFDADEITALATELFGSWASPQPFERLAFTYSAAEPTSLTIETPDKANAFMIAGTTIEMRDDDDDHPAMVLGNYMLGGGFLNSRLAVRIRQQDGLSYGVGSSFSASPLDRNAQFLTQAIYAPANAARVEAAFREEIERVLADGFTDDEVEKAKEGYLQSRQLARADDGPLARALASGLYIDRTLEHDAALEATIAALTPQRIVEALRRHIDPARFVIVKAGDFGASADVMPAEAALDPR